MGIQEEYQKKRHELKDGSGDGSGYSTRRFARRVN